MGDIESVEILVVSLKQNAPEITHDKLLVAINCNGVTTLVGVEMILAITPDGVFISVISEVKEPIFNDMRSMRLSITSSIVDDVTGV